MTATRTGSRRLGLSLETRIFLVTSLLIAASVVAAVAATTILLRQIARDAAVESLERSASVQEMLEERRYDDFQLSASNFVSEPYLVAYLAEAAADREILSILDALGEGQKQLGFDFGILLDPNGVVVARTDRPNATGENLSQRALVKRALRETAAAAGVWQEGGSLFYAVAVPVQQGFDLLGYFVTGFAITKKLADEVYGVSGADVAFASTAEPGVEISVTTLRPETVKTLAASLSESGAALGNAMRAGQELAQTEVTLDGERWLAKMRPLLDAEGKPVGATVALASLGRELAVYRQIQNVLIGSGLAAVLLAPVLAFVITRRTLAPVKRLVSAATAARQGNYDQKIASERNDEVGQLAHAFSDLLSDLREKRDMEAYVTELSRNLPEPREAPGVIGEPQSRDVLLVAVELRGQSRAAELDPRAALDRLGVDLSRVTGALARRRGTIEVISGHRVLARFEGEGRGQRALTAAAQILAASSASAGSAGQDGDGPVVAMAAGKAITGPVAVGEQTERALVGLPVQQLETLLREATPGEVILSREVHEELRELFEGAGYSLAPRRGVITPLPLYVVTPQLAATVTGISGFGGIGGQPPAETPTGLLEAASLATLSGISPGAIMGRRFEILSVLGTGGMGVVYKARDRELDDLVALKMLKRDLWGDGAQLERLKSELKLARKITHPNVLRTHDFGEIDGVPYISMEYVRGVTLRYMLDQSDRLPYSAGLRLAKQLVAGLAAAHAVGVLHRDIKPENLILEPTGNAKLMDFGIARPIERLSPGQTQAGMVVGTPQYMAPEIIQGREADVRSDLYSCGVVFYEIFTGKLPLTGATAMEICIKALRDEPAPPSAHWREIPPRLEGIILRCLKKDPKERFRSTAELLQELATLSA